mmetsp:Transcript_31843/g.92511  ORF Transcript_31843/g.92511 Transcript_31843/m.92511 type:complete len:147 (+) Transcript_31843:1497-1937(+)
MGYSSFPSLGFELSAVTVSRPMQDEGIAASTLSIGRSFNPFEESTPRELRRGEDPSLVDLDSKFNTAAEIGPAHRSQIGSIIQNRSSVLCVTSVASKASEASWATEGATGACDHSPPHSTKSIATNPKAWRVDLALEARIPPPRPF